MTKIIQITDLHVGREGEKTMGVDVRQNFKDLLLTARKLRPDLLVLTGDLCFHEGDEKVYNWIRSHLDFLNINYTAIAGNHDDPFLLAEAFGMEKMAIGSQLFYRRDFNHFPVLFLGTAAGVVSPTQLEWLRVELTKIKTDAVIFMHHPPVIGGVPFMDGKHRLRNISELQEVLFNFDRHLTIFCGHYHVEKTINLKNLTVHITPSAYFQIDWKEQGFKVDHHRIGLREIVLRDDGAVESTVIYQEGNKTSDEGRPLR
jgi:Icc protein